MTTLSNNAKRLLGILTTSYAQADGTIALPPLPELQTRMDGLHKTPLVSCLRRLIDGNLIKLGSAEAIKPDSTNLKERLLQEVEEAPEEVVEQALKYLQFLKTQQQ